MRQIRLCVCLVAVLMPACERAASPVAPSSSPVPAVPSPIVLEAEAGSGDGDLMQRSRASGGQTIHLAPGQRRRWTFTLQAPASRYAVMVTYSNANPGDVEVLRIEVDGQPLGSIRAQDTGDDGEGWNVFVADFAGTSMLGPGPHTAIVESTGGDGCIEIDLVTIRPESGRGSMVTGPGE
jgi:hypothetical protein